MRIALLPACASAGPKAGIISASKRITLYHPLSILCCTNGLIAEARKNELELFARALHMAADAVASGRNLEEWQIASLTKFWLQIDENLRTHHHHEEGVDAKAWHYSAR